MASRKASHKMKSALDERQKRLLRVHRRSLDQREMRQEGMNKRRQIEDLSPVIESQDASKIPSASATPVSQSAAVPRLEKLKKWKEERELKRKLEAMEKIKSKPGFKVFHVSYKETHLYQKEKSASSEKPVPAVALQVAKPRTAQPAAKASTLKNTVKTTHGSSKQTADAGQAAKKAVAVHATDKTTHGSSKQTADAGQAAKKAVAVHATDKTTHGSSKQTADSVHAAKTRSRGASTTKSVADVPHKKVKQSPPKRGTRSNFMAPTAASRTRAAATIKKEAESAPAARKIKAAHHQQAKSGVSTQKDEKSDPTEEQSFAPKDFVFEAPSNVQSFVFKPLSPASAASFLFPQGGANADSTTMSAFTTRVGRTSTPKCDGQPTSSSEEDTCDELKRAADGSGRGSCSTLESRSTLHGSLSLIGRKQVSERLGSCLDSGIEVNTAGTDSVHIKTPSQNSADDVTSSVEEQHTTRQKSSPGKSRKGRRHRGSVSKSLIADLKSEQEKQTDASESEGAITEEPASSTSLVSKKGKRKSKRVTIVDDPTAGTEHSEIEKSEAKRRKSNRSTAINESESENKLESHLTVSLSTLPLSEKATEKQETPMKSLRSHRSTAAITKDEQVAQVSQADTSVAKLRLKLRRSTLKSESADDAEVQQTSAAVSESPRSPLSEKAKEQETPVKSRRSRRSAASKSKGEQDYEVIATRKSWRSNLTSADSREDSKTAGGEDLATMEEDTVKEVVATISQKSRRSESKQKDPVKSKDKSLNQSKLGTNTEMETQVIKEPTTPESRRHNLRSKDDMFLTPGPPLSQKQHSTAKRRRRTATMIALSSAKSPEEAIKIIATSPMVEMTRRTPKTKISPELQNKSREQEFFGNNFTLAPLKLSAAFEAELAHTGSMADARDAAVNAGNNQSAASTSKLQESTNSDAGMQKRNVTQFREQLSAEIQKLTELSKHWTAITENTKDLPDEVEGQVRTTVGQAQLLMDRKGRFHQFAGLLDTCEAGGDPATTCQDLQGLWDLTFIQVQDIYSNFEKLEQLQQKQWQPDVSVVAAAAQPALGKKPVAGGSKKPVGKSRFAAFRAQLIHQHKVQEMSDTAISDKPEEKVFDAGFFKVSSPVRTPTYHCEAGTPSKPRSGTAYLAEDRRITPNTCRSRTEATFTVSPKMADKENIAQVLLRRSMGATPGRRSYIPSIPSPLLDSTPPARSPALSPSRATNAAAANSEQAEALDGKEDMTVRPCKSLPKRRSTRSRKSVLFEKQDDGVQQYEGVDMMAYLQPSTSQTTTSAMESVLEEGSPFTADDILKHSKPETPMTHSPGRQRKNNLKSLPSAEKRRTRRSVTFAASTNTPQRAVALPSTPYNRNSLVAARRVRRGSTAVCDGHEQSAVAQLHNLSGTPTAKRCARPSLLYTPPKVDNSRPTAPARAVPVAKLISFSPSAE